MHHQIDLTAADLKKVLLSGGIALDARYVNNYKKMGGRTNIQLVQKSFQVLQSFAFGVCKTNNLFILHNDLCNRISVNEDLQNRLTQIGVSLFMLQEAMKKKDSVLPPPKKKIKTLKENLPPTGVTSPQSSSAIDTVEPMSVLLSSPPVLEEPATNTEHDRHRTRLFTLPVSSELQLDNVGHLLNITNKL